MIPNHDLIRTHLQRLSLLRLASLGVWLAFLLYLQFLGFKKLALVWLLLATYTGLTALGAWRAWRGQVRPYQLLLQLIIECELFALMLYLSGGSANPLISYYLVLLVMASYSLPRKQALAITLLTVIDYSALTQWHKPLLLHSMADHSQSLFDLHMLGMWLTFVVSAVILITLIPALVHSRETQRQEIHTLREQQLKNEQLIGIATLAAGTAHEMGTPLMTMNLLLGDLKAQEPLSSEDLNILQTQVGTCRAALKRLAHAGREARSSGQQLAADWLKNLLERWRLSHPKALWHDHGLGAYALIAASPLLDQALLNLLDNAAEAGSEPVHLYSSVQEGFWQLDIVQSDPKAAQNLHERHTFSSSKEHGMGLGLYLSNASIEQFGGNIHLLAQAEGSTLCRLRLPVL